MDGPFIYDKYVTGKNFIGRKEECTILSNLLAQKENIVMYSAPKGGKMSVIQQTLFGMRVKGQQFMTGHFTLVNVRTVEGFLCRLGSTVLRTVASTPSEYAALVQKHLGGTHFVYDQQHYAMTDEIVSLNWDVDDNDIRTMLELPGKIALEKASNLFIIIDEFSNLDFSPKAETVYKCMEKVFEQNRRSLGPGAVFILTGSRLNAMKSIFEVRKFFYRRIEKLSLNPIDHKDIVEYAVKGFLAGGKVVDRELLRGACELFRSDIYYLNHFMGICDSLSKGYIIETTLLDALDIIISIHTPRFISIMNDLTSYQVSLLRALLEGYNKFSSSEVIEKYGLNSSANVKRLREALVKKEIITFDEKDEPKVIDPLFEYWAKKFYFEIKDI